LQDLAGTPQPNTTPADFGFCGVDTEVSSVKLVHRSKHRPLTGTQRRWLKRRQVIEPIIGHALLTRG
jgi:hypothetical protein